ncbi:MAG: hypothetical protein R3C31_07575 [Hyphomonadaceae bacterium]
MSYKLKLGVALAVAALALPTLAAAQDPTTRLDVTVVGAVLTSDSEQATDRNAVATPALPIVYEDDTNADASTAEASTADAAANLGHGVESE